MESQSNIAPLIVILGETGSGKSDLAMALAKQFNGEIISADSRAVYKGMDVGTAKPSLEDRKRIKHYLIDVVTPDQRFTVVDFKGRAQAAIDEITSAGKVVFLVGGTGLYIDALLYDFSFRPAGNQKLREELSALSAEELLNRLVAQGLPVPEQWQNKRHLIRVLESGGVQPTKAALRPSTLLIGLRPERNNLRATITARVDIMVQNGFIDELKRLVWHYGWGLPALQTPGYKAFRSYINGDGSLDEAKQAFIRNDMRLARRQRTWFKRNEAIQWENDRSKIVGLVTTFLNK
ncbi:MAG TPA: tRNA (adenosine(37)-N6)-dimethylallyltransferase MiaA [Candidatus Saccharimonadales bacterium]|nr:tRNA (adenosine(37)-N6)-dimethylallyltransferase MiaA [Candidatus Saccharimonadales bacterium]